MSYLFDPEVRGEVVRMHLGAPIEQQFVGVSQTLRSIYGDHVSPGQRWMFSNAGGIMCSISPLHVSPSEYLLFDAVTYSNASKTNVLGVSEETLRGFGAVSEETAMAMVRGVLRAADADLGVSVTGIAGPGGGTDDKPVGTVWIGVGNRGGVVYAKRFLFRGDRERIRVMSTYTALRLIQELANDTDRA